ncbi:DUF742 domain-containing protein [Nocardioides gilvus]|uniref:DUF742 domain-containing protein n=1 Tax=Nocardioides gilvus TaxID=1735589 RepID=UPI000D74BC62|nr:DUF742 domain-containing protein [Nocardioides gilvus]
MSPKDPDWDDAPAPRVVRAFTITAGRTKPKVDLPVEATLRLEEHAHGRSWPNAAVAHVVDVCHLRSVAEVSALVSMPIGVVRVLLADLIEAGHVAVQATISSNTSSDQRRDLIERTLRGLRAF